MIQPQEDIQVNRQEEDGNDNLPLHTAESQDSTASASSSNTSQNSRQEMMLRERNWQSMHNLTNHRHRPPSSSRNDTPQDDDNNAPIAPLPVLPGRSPMDLSHFHESWSTTPGDDWFGISPVSLTGRTITNPFSSSSSLLPQRPDRVGYRHSSATAASTNSSMSVSSHSPMMSHEAVDSSGVSSVIHDAARITNWDRVLELCQTQPEAAAYTSPRDGWTALHHACSRRCPHPHVVQALIASYPPALSQPDKEKWGWVPLHYACRFKAPKEVVQLLLHLCPERGIKTVSILDRMGRTPLFYAIRYDAPPGVVGLLLQVDPSAVLEEDQNADSPLALVWDSWAEKLEGKRVVNSFLPGGFPEPEECTVEQRAQILRDRLQRETKLRKRWQKANMLLKAAFGFSVDDDDEEGNEDGSNEMVVDEKTAMADSEDRKWRIVHATAAVKCHLSLFLLACALHPEQVQELDEFDLRRPGDPHAADLNPRQTALHLAASSNAGGEPGKTVLLTLLSHYREAAQMPDGIDESLPLHRMVENPKKRDWSNHAAILYRFYPRAVQIPDSNGKLPLHRAAAAVTNEEQTDEESVILQLLRVFPQAALHADHSGLLPLHSLAAHASHWDSGVEAVYNIHRNAVLVRAGPRHFHRLPLHMAATSSISREPLLSRLLLHHPRAASMPDSQGKLPFFLACEQGKSWNDGSRCLHASFPASVQTREENARGWFPLHAAAYAPAADADLIAHLVELNPQAASVPDAQGRYPLHLACRAGKSWTEGGISILFDVDPSPMATVDHRGMLPFHCAAFRHCSLNPQEERKEEELMTEPALQAKREKDAAHVDILFNLLRADPTVLERS